MHIDFGYRPGFFSVILILGSVHSWQTFVIMVAYCNILGKSVKFQTFSDSQPCIFLSFWDTNLEPRMNCNAGICTHLLHSDRKISFWDMIQFQIWNVNNCECAGRPIKIAYTQFIIPGVTNVGITWYKLHPSLLKQEKYGGTISLGPRDKIFANKGSVTSLTLIGI